MNARAAVRSCEIAMKITFFENGNNMAFENGQQVPVAQKPWIVVYAEYLASQGIDPTAVEIEMPHGTRVRVLKTEVDGEDSYNWELEL